MHRTGTGIDRGVIATGLLIDLRRSAGEFIPEAVQIDALATSYQAFGVWAAEREVPQQRTAYDLVPWRDARHRRIHHHQLVGAFRIARGVGIGDHGTDVVADHVRVLDAQLGQHGADVAGLGFLVVAAGRMRGQAHAAQVGYHDRVVARQFGRHRRPHVAGVAEAVYQHDGRAAAADAHVDGGAVAGHFLRVEA